MFNGNIEVSELCMFNIIFTRKLAYKQKESLQPWLEIDLPQASLAAFFSSLQEGLPVWLPSRVLSPYAHKLPCSQAKIYPRKQCLCPGVSPQGEWAQLELSDESVYRVS